MEAIHDIGRAVLGLGLKAEELGAAQMGLRALIIYVITVTMVRLGKKRFMGQASAFDVILGIVLGSIVSRAVTGNAPFGPALVACAVLIGAHSLFSALALRWHGFGELIKGRAQVLVQGGAVQEGAMRQAHMSDRDLWEDLREKGVGRLEEVAEARLERNGRVSVIRAREEPKVVEVAVADGVQTVRIEMAGG